MAILVKPYLGCNMNCTYCYEARYREKNRPAMNYSLDKVLSTVEKQYEKNKQTGITLHGGEPLCMPKDDVESILRKAHELSCRSSIQTNGLLIDDDYKAMFKKYNTNVGVSFDGPGDLSEFRTTPQNANKIYQTVKDMVKEGVNVSHIVVISKSNAGTDDKFNRFKSWLLELAEMNLGGRLNPCGDIHELGAYGLPEDRLIYVYLDLAKFLLEHGLRWSPFEDISKRTRGETAVCTFMGCDPFHTESAAVILGDGLVTNCMRTNQGDIVLRDQNKRITRSEVLQEIPQEFGGCRDCEFWNECNGGCPTMTVDNDWRNRTYLCPLWKELFKYYRNITNALGLKSTKNQCKTNKSHTNIGNKKPGHKDIHNNTPHTNIGRKN